MNTTEQQISVRDQLAVQSGGFRVGHWLLITVKKITPSGRLVCDRYTLNPDLTIRGSGHGFNTGPYKAVHITPEILESIRREKALSRFNLLKSADLTTHQLEAILKITK